MYEIRFFRDRRGRQPVKELLLELAVKKKKDKSARVNFEKIVDYIRKLQSDGKGAGEPYIKHLESEIWELRPLRHRILFVGVHENSFYLLHHFLKKTQKTPQSEIDKAKRELAYLLEGEDSEHE